MCGICGEVGERAEGRSGRLAVILAALAHRGPDGEGRFLAPEVALGHRRLAVIDPVGGRQPLATDNAELQLVANGEIYNHRLLRAELAGRAGNFRTGSDNEVILRLYAARRNDWSAAAPGELLGRLEGMFAFALWDGPARRLWLARDRLGKKPLFYMARPDGGLAFASELAALRQSQAGPWTPDPAALWHFFKYGYLPAPLTPWREVRQLPPAHYLLWEAGRVELARYWDLPPLSESFSGSPADLDEEFSAQLSLAVGGRLMSDVPLGAFLSGGLDSTVISALMARVGVAQPRTFCLGFEDRSYDERPAARAAAAAVGTIHEELLARPELAAELPALTARCGEPVGDSSTLNLWRLCREARARVTVCLTGDGADELLGGYRRYRGRLWGAHYRRLPAWLRQGLIEPAVRGWPEAAGYYGHSLGKRAKLFIAQAGRLAADDLAIFTLPFEAEWLAQLLKGGAPEADLPRAAAERWAAAGPAEQMLRADLQTYLPGDILHKTDRASLAHGLEIRNPFLDHRLVEYCCRLPAAAKVNLWAGKLPLRRLAQRLVPGGPWNRPKHGFMLPLDRWFRQELRDWARQATAELPADQFDRAAVDRLWAEHLAGRCDHSTRLYLLLAWAVWADQAA